MESIGTGKMISLLADGRKVWIDQLLGFLKEGMKMLITWGFLIYLIAQVRVEYAIGLVGGLIIMHIIVIYIDTIAHKDRKVRTNEKWELTRKFVRIVMSKNEILQNNQIWKELREVEKSVGIIDAVNFKLNRSMYFIFNLVRLFAFGIRIAVLVFIGYGVFHGTFTLTEFATIMAMVIVFESFLFDSTEFYKNFTKDFSDIEKLWEVLDNGPVMKWYDSGSSFSPKSKDIEISSISYGYNETPVFSDFSLTIKRGQKTALVGASGGGKTTLMKLIAGYLHPETGSISVLWNNLGETALKSYYPHIGYLTQDPSVFDATIRENLLSAMSEKSSPDIEKELKKALKLAHCDFVFDLEKWLDTEIGERGVRLSGGQKQRLAIAKIFLKDPEIILLDEPTSALDSFSEEAITVALDELFKNRTVIIVAHRLQTVRKADEIIVLEHGQIAERGTHTELVEKWGIYNRMLELQSGF
jgi:ABC-type multidrug transport system fused ATPase/permease subunit